MGQGGGVGGREERWEVGRKGCSKISWWENVC